MTPLQYADDLGSLGADTLRRRYRDGTLTPVEVVAAVLARIEARGDDGVWISRVDAAAVLERARSLDLTELDGLPLFGIPFGLKDNVDAAGEVTTAACPAFAYPAGASAALVERLLDAGAILVGKTNLDQFATGLNGTRSPYGVPESVFGEHLIAGGSSSGSAVAVAAGLVTFAIGTDTAGSGRVPAALNNVVGVKPSIGLVSTRGVVPACPSLDCPSVFALTVADGAAVLAAIAGYDDADPGSRSYAPLDPVPAATSLVGARFAVPADVEGWGTREERTLWEDACGRLVEAGAVLVPVDLTDFLDAGTQLYGGPWIAERYAVMAELLGRDPGAVLPELRALVERVDEISTADVFAGTAAMSGRRHRAHRLLADFDALLTPTCTTTFTVAEMLADPIRANERLGVFTTFTNLLDLCALALPAGLAGGPFGITLHAPAGEDGVLAGLGAAIEDLLGVVPGGPGLVAAEPVARPAVVPDGFELAVVGAHLAGMPLHGDLVARGAELVALTTTSPDYRLHALAGTVPPKPGLERVPEGGCAVEVEVYRLPYAEVGSFLATVHHPLGIGELTLADGSAVHGFICEPAGLAGATDVTRYGGWRAYVADR